MYQKPERLRKGDRIGIFLPSSPIKEPFRTNGLSAIRGLGFEPVEVDRVFRRRGFLAREPGQTIRDIASFFSDCSIKALWAGRGGYGANLVLEEMEKLDVHPPKIVIGSSDMSYILWYLLDRRRTVVFYGPMVYSALAEGRFVRKHLLGLLTGTAETLRIRGRVILPGCCRGYVTGGCLTNLASLIGTPFMPVIHDRILLLEDVNERPYRLDRMLWQISQAGIFPHIRGLLLGEFPGCFSDSAEKQVFFLRIRHMLGKYRIPVIGSLPFGHAARCSTLPLGIEVEIDTDSFSGIRLAEKGVI